ncbi:CBS domain-containing protein [Nocardiopsis mwathae]|uniref:CBS domain-containing protein n=1 Tax=Nocardiopsis mwathae TaxID=1472723 RepID=A0A7W9YNR2_9ACTN|nr:CBS domain-containing protein [Nocardiopsis mwathae]MBB6174886.1 CBS domain-containing protein [Nocardiopsis mwathae]
MIISNVYRPTVLGCQADDRLTEVARRMAEEQVGALAVFDGAYVVGIITERDLVRAMATAHAPADESAAAYASTRVETAGLNEDSQRVARRMLDAGIRHLPVVDDERMVGMVSMRDLLALEAWTS